MNALTVRRRLLTAVSLLIAALLTAAANADTMDDLGPRIESCRVGSGDAFKVGHWTPLRISISPGANQAGVGGLCELQVESVDSDGVPTITSSDSFTLSAATSRQTVLVKVGKLNSRITVRLLADGLVVDERAIRPGQPINGQLAVADLPAMAELIVAAAPSAFGLREALSDRAGSEGMPARRIVPMSDVSELPKNWLGYDGVDVLVLSIGDGSLWRALAGDAVRLAALQEWVETGGKLVILFGGRAGADLVTGEVSLAPIAPGRFDGPRSIGRLVETAAIEQFAQTSAAIVRPGERSQLGAVQLIDPEGKVELHARGAAQMPVVTRAPRGLGEVTFVGLDLDVPPLSTWPGRSGLLRAILKPLIAGDQPDTMSRNLITSGYEDLSGALRQRLARSFAGVRPTSFSSVVGLSLLYILVLGPVQFFVLRKWVKQPWIAWASFLFILLFVGFGAVALADIRGVKTPRLNSAEVIDFDIASGRTRSTFWAALYSPIARRFDATFTPSGLSSEFQSPQSVLSWDGLAGAGIGGMRASGPDIVQISTAYRVQSSPQLFGAPLLNAGVKSLIARTSSTTEEPIEVQLRDINTMLAGRFVNRSGTSLLDAHILYGMWAYRLKDIPPGDERTFDEETVAVSLKTLLTGIGLGVPAGIPLSSERATFPADTASVDELLNVMFFYDALGGAGFAGLPFRYQNQLDLSRQLALGRAVLVAKVAEPASQLAIGDTSESMSSNSEGAAQTILRFVLPVSQNRD